MISPAELAAFMSSRICHDLVSPVSSVASALDFMNEPNDSEMRQQAEQLLAKGAADAAARLEFLRYAFGSMGLSDGAADIHQAKEISERFAATMKPSVSWDIETDHLSFSHARLMMNILMLGMEALPRGGVVEIRVRNDNDGLVITATARGARARLREDSATALRGEAPEEGWNSRIIQPLFARMIASDLGGEISLREGEEEVLIIARGLRAEG